MTAITLDRPEQMLLEEILSSIVKPYADPWCGDRQMIRVEVKTPDQMRLRELLRKVRKANG